MLKLWIGRCPCVLSQHYSIKLLAFTPGHTDTTISRWGHHRLTFSVLDRPCHLLSIRLRFCGPTGRTTMLKFLKHTGRPIISVSDTQVSFHDLKRPKSAANLPSKTNTQL